MSFLKILLEIFTFFEIIYQMGTGTKKNANLAILMQKYTYIPPKMARLPRFFRKGGIFHIYNRFNPELSLQQRDLKGIEYLIKSSVNRFPIKILYFAILKNHFHLVIKFPQDENVNSSILMQWLGTTIAKYTNRKLKRSGTVFCLRFKSLLVNTKRQIRNLINYLINNPLKHHGVTPKNWEFSSYNFYFRNKKDDITTHYEHYIL